MATSPLSSIHNPKYILARKLLPSPEKPPKTPPKFLFFRNSLSSVFEVSHPRTTAAFLRLPCATIAPPHRRLLSPLAYTLTRSPLLSLSSLSRASPSSSSRCSHGCTRLRRSTEADEHHRSTAVGSLTPPPAILLPLPCFRACSNEQRYENTSLNFVFISFFCLNELKPNIMLLTQFNGPAS